MLVVSSEDAHIQKPSSAFTVACLSSLPCKSNHHYFGDLFVSVPLHENSNASLCPSCLRYILILCPRGDCDVCLENTVGGGGGNVCPRP